MCPVTPPTLTRLDPRYPLLWRDADTVQFGLESVVRIDVAGPWVEPLLNRLRAGIRLSSFDVVAHGVGAPRHEARRMLAALRPLLVDDALPAPPFWVDGINLPDGRGQERLRQSLIDEGLDEADPRAPGAVAVVMIGGAVAALQMAPYARRRAAPASRVRAGRCCRRAACRAGAHAVPLLPRRARAGTGRGVAATARTAGRHDRAGDVGADRAGGDARRTDPAHADPRRGPDGAGQP